MNEQIFEPQFADSNARVVQHSRELVLNSLSRAAGRAFVNYQGFFHKSLGKKVRFLLE